MKKSLNFLTVTILLGITFIVASCSKEETPAPTSTAPATTTPPLASSTDYYYKCKIQGLDWVSTSPMASIRCYLG